VHLNIFDHLLLLVSEALHVLSLPFIGLLILHDPLVEGSVLLVQVFSISAEPRYLKVFLIVSSRELVKLLEKLVCP
jgi:hypothetical protein